MILFYVINCITGSDLLIFFEDFSMWREGKLVGRINEKEVKETVLGCLKRGRIMTGKRLCFPKANMAAWFLFIFLIKKRLDNTLRDMM